MSQRSLARELPAYVENLRALLRLDERVWRAVVERQILAVLLPGLSGNRVSLEGHLWDLLVLCLEGHDASPPPLDDARFEQAAASARAGRGLSGIAAAPFPRAARGLVDALVVLRETGVFPRPLVS